MKTHVDARKAKSSASATGEPAAVRDSLTRVAGNAGDRDALALRSFGGTCGADDNTTQLVDFGTGNRTDITDAARSLRAGGEPTLARGVVEAVADFDTPFSRDAKQVNRIIVITRHGADACDDDAGFVAKEIRDRVEAAGLAVEFRLIGYQDPSTGAPFAGDPLWFGCDEGAHATATCTLSLDTGRVVCLGTTRDPEVAAAGCQPFTPRNPRVNIPLGTTEIDFPR